MAAATTLPDEETCRTAPDAEDSTVVQEARVDEATSEVRVAAEVAAPPVVETPPKQPTHERVNKDTECYMVGVLNCEVRRDQKFSP